MNFTFSEVIDKNLLQKIFEFRYKIFLEIYPEYLTTSGFTNTQEFDKYDEYSENLAIFDEDGNVCASVRLIHSSPIGYPTENSMTFNKNNFQREKLAEVSRIFIDKKYRSIKSTKIILDNLKKFMYVRMMQLNIEYSYGSLEKNFLRLLKILKMCYHTLEEEQICGCFGSRYPCILYTKQLGDDNPELIKLWERKCEI